MYLDQNKWIQLAQIFNGKNKSPEALEVLHEIKTSIEHGYIYPLSATHYLELSRIANLGRRQRLGQVMWDFSKNKTLASSENIVTHEIEVALSRYFNNIKSSPLNLIGEGIANAFGQPALNEYPQISNFIDMTMLTGSDTLEIEPIKYFSEKCRQNFQSHLIRLNTTKKQLEKSHWDNWLNVITLNDISKPLATVMMANDIYP